MRVSAAVLLWRRGGSRCSLCCCWELTAAAFSPLSLLSYRQIRCRHFAASFRWCVPRWVCLVALLVEAPPLPIATIFILWVCALFCAPLLLCCVYDSNRGCLQFTTVSSTMLYPIDESPSSNFLTSAMRLFLPISSVPTPVAPVSSPVLEIHPDPPPPEAPPHPPCPPTISPTHANQACAMPPSSVPPNTIAATRPILGTSVTQDR